MKIIKVALIEDDAAIVDMYQGYFKLTGGFEIKVANDGAHGLELLQSYTPDVVLLDMMMPTMSGVETLTRLRKLSNGDSYKVIALTNMKDDDTMKTIKTLGVSEYLVKAENSPAKIQEYIRSVVGVAAPAAA